MGCRLMHSQHEEEGVILEYFKGKKCPERFLDIGAFDGKCMSNTYALAELGWGGVCVEPSPQVFKGLMANHKGRDDITLVNAAISDRAGLAPFQCSPDAVSTLDEDHYKKWKKLGQYTGIWVATATLHDLLTRFPGPYSFINIDTEGTSVDILNRMPLDELGVQMICIEFDERAAEADACCQKFGMQNVYNCGGNTIWAK